MARKLVCFRVVDLAVPHTASREDACSVCGEAVWRALSSPGNVKAICSVCLQSETRGRKVTIESPTPEQIEDALRHPHPPPPPPTE